MFFKQNNSHIQELYFQAVSPPKHFALPSLPIAFSPSPVCPECYLAGAQHSRHAVAVSQGELDLDVDPPRSLSRDPDRPQPVVLAGAHHVTDLIQSKCYN